MFLRLLKDGQLPAAGIRPHRINLIFLILIIISILILNITALTTRNRSYVDAGLQKVYGYIFSRPPANSLIIKNDPT
jgi:hypothetical protein